MNAHSDRIRMLDKPVLHDPLMIIALKGWNDGGKAPSKALKYLIRSIDAKQFAEIDPEPYYVFSERRPEVRISDSGTREIHWPRNEFYYGNFPENGRDVILFLGEEAHLAWSTYVGHLIEIANQFNVKSIITMGAFLADILYNVPCQVYGWSNDIDMKKEYGLTRTQYEGPTGLIGVSGQLFQAHNFSTFSLWTGVPYYVSLPNPRGTHALLNLINLVFGLNMDVSSFEEATEKFDTRIDAIVASDSTVAAYVRKLRKRELHN